MRYLFLHQIPIKGLMNSPNTILLTSDGSVQTIPNFDYLTATSMLNRLGLEVNVITLSDVLISSGERCTIDQAGWWTQIINGVKISPLSIFGYGSDDD